MTGLEQIIETIVRRVIREELAELKEPTVDHVTVAAYAAKHSLGVSTVREAIREGRLPAVKIGRAVRVPAEAQIGAPVRVVKVETPAAIAARILAGGR